MKNYTLWHGHIKYADSIADKRKRDVEVRIQKGFEKDDTFVEYWAKDRWAPAGIQMSLDTYKQAFMVRHATLHQVANSLTDSLNGVE